MTVRLETLDLTPAELEASREAIQRMAYFNWLAAGRPEGGQVDFWVQAEREWIERCYVPSRPLDGTRPQAERQPAAADDLQPAEAKRSRPRETVEAR